MSLAPATRLGPYEIVAPLGAGGMGEVYRAKDSRLGREVAVKVLPADVATDPERLRRFELEAKAASAIHHPNLLTVFDVGRHDDTAFLVTELLDGESLRELVRKGPLPPKRAAELATQLARGLAAAHDQGIVHRDLKPENLFLTRDGRAKILDFGLARIERPELSQADLNNVSTVLETQAGTVLGTVGYMAPEQVRGERADARSDLFSLGVVLHELLSGANPFRRDSTIESLNAILKEEPADLAATPSGANPALARVVARLLEKDPARRFRSAHDLVFALEGATLATSGAVPAPPASPSDAVARRWRPAVAGLALLAAGLVGGSLLRPAPRSAMRHVQFEFAPPGEGGFPASAEVHNFTLAPDGRTLAYVTTVAGQARLELRDLASVTPRPLAGTEGAQSPFWSPDGASLAFFAGGKLKRVARDGGPVQTICEVQGTTTGAWSRDGTIVYSQGFGPSNGLFRVAAGGGAPAALAFDRDLPRWIEFLPDGQRFLVWSRGPDSFNGELAVYDLATGRATALAGIHSQARYAAPGWLLYLRGSTLVAQRFDAAAAELRGEPVPVASSVPHFFNGWGSFTVGGATAIAYQVQPAPQPLAWFDRHGRELGRVGPAARHLAVRLSPDGGRAAVTRSDPDTAFTDVWIVDLARGGATRLTDEPYLEWSPAWSPDGELVAYTTPTKPPPEFIVTVRRVADGAKVKALPPHPSFFWVRGWSRAGAFLDANQPATGWDIWQWPTLDAEPSPLLATEFAELLPSPSPDGRWLAFYSRDSGSGEIELIRRDTPGRRLRVSRGAYLAVPRWRGDGGELFYLAADGWLSTVSVGAGDPPTLGEPQPLFRVDLAVEDGFDVTADGQRFLLAGTPPSSALPIRVVLDWQAELPER
ncbi:MAG: serine/threonine-protein kinase [Thermoanaerobaculia bacterium]|nr:serine/threonine-protein kinase [Thermoanaerobaculia bacterium]